MYVLHVGIGRKLAGGLVAMSAAVMSLGAQPGAHAAPAALLDVVSSAGLTEVNESFAASPFDYDADGDQDVLIVYHDQGAKLWRNDGGVFTRVAATAFPAKNATGTMIDRHDCAWADVNGDDRMDVSCTVGRGTVSAVKTSSRPDNELWIQQVDGSFVDQGTEWGIGDPYGRGRDAVFLDANGDQWPDLYIGNELPRAGDTDGATSGSSKLYLNQGGTSFLDSPEFGLNQHNGGKCANAADLDGDGDQDVLMCGQHGVRIYHNQAFGGFSDVTAASGFPTFVSDGIEKSYWFKDVDLADLDNDGDLDVVGIRPERVAYRLNDGRGVFGPQKTIKLITHGREVATGDADRDGDIDVFALNANDPKTGANVNDLLFLNSALTFTSRVAPSATGRGDTVEALDYDGDADADFLVLNGLDVKGPVQLLSYR